MKKLALILIVVMMFPSVFTQETVITVDYYYVDGCPYCEEVENIIDDIGDEYSTVKVVRMNVYESTVYMEEFTSYGFWKVPAVVINGKATFQGEEEVTEENIRETIEEYQHSYTQGNSFFEQGKEYYTNKEYKKAQIYLGEAKKLFDKGNFNTNATVAMLEDCNSCIGADRLIFAGDTFLENGYTGRAKEMYSQVACESLDEIAATRIEHIAVYEETLQKFDTAVEYYEEEKYSQALTVFNSIESILVGEKKEKCKDYIEKCGKYEEVGGLYSEAVAMIFTDPIVAQKKFLEAGKIHALLGNHVEKYRTFADASLHFYLGKEFIEVDAESASYHFEEAKKDFASLHFQRGVEKCEEYIEKSRTNNMLYWISFILVLIFAFVLAYFFYFRKKKKEEKNKKDNKGELKDLIEKYANGKMSLKEYDKKKKRVIK